MMDAQPSAIVIEEVGVPDPIRITLEGDDLPEGSPREQTAWEEGGIVKLGDDEGTYYPGRTEPDYFVLQVRQRPRVLKGSFRDSQWGESGRARRMEEALERMRQRANPLSIAWELEFFDGFLQEAKFGVEGPGDITYELTLLVSSVAASNQTARETKPTPTSDDVASLLDDLAALKARLAAAALAATVRLSLLTLFGAVEQALADCADAVALAETATAGVASQVASYAGRVVAAARDVRDRATELRDVVGALHVTDLLDAATSTDEAQFAEVQADMLAEMTALRDTMRTLAVATLDQVSQSRIYQVRPGDTLDSVALSQLGDRGRAGDLGLTPAQLAARVGQYIRLPR